MNTPRRYTTPILLCGVAAISIAFFTYASKSKSIIADQDDSIKVLQTSMDNIQEDFSRTLEANDLLIIENEDLKATIAQLEKKIANLRWKVKKQDQSIKKSKTELQKLQASLAAKQAELSKMKTRMEELGSDDGKIQKIKALEAENEHLKASVEQLTKMLDEELATQEENKLELIASKLREEKIEALRNVIFNTKVSYIEISPSKREMGKELRKIRKDGKKWKYTSVSFKMDHDDPTVFEGKTFELKIINMTTGEPIAYIESNPMYPESTLNATGIQFEYTGEAMNLIHKNTDIKVGQNYRAEISLVEDGQYYPLIHGDQAFVVNKKTLKN